MLYNLKLIKLYSIFDIVAIVIVIWARYQKSKKAYVKIPTLLYHDFVDSGLVEIFSHSKRHVFYDKLPVREIRDDVIESYKIIEEINKIN